MGSSQPLLAPLPCSFPLCSWHPAHLIPKTHPQWRHFLPPEASAVDRRSSCERTALHWQVQKLCLWTISQGWQPLQILWESHRVVELSALALGWRRWGESSLPRCAPAWVPHLKQRPCLPHHPPLGLIVLLGTCTVTPPSPTRQPNLFCLTHD